MYTTYDINSPISIHFNRIDGLVVNRKYKQ